MIPSSIDVGMTWKQKCEIIRKQIAQVLDQKKTRELVGCLILPLSGNCLKSLASTEIMMSVKPTDVTKIAEMCLNF